MRVKTFNTLPSEKDHFWQVILFPSICILRSISDDDQYTAVNFEWLFWSLTVLIND
jgi:hypothetical protein